MAKRTTKKTAKRTTKKKEVAVTDAAAEEGQEVQVAPLDDLILSCLKQFGDYAINERAIPALQDGLKPSQRRILWSAYLLRSTPNNNFVRSARLTGAALQFHPHNAVALYGALVKMAAHIPQTLFDIQGNFGNYSKSTPAAADRYCFHGNTLVTTATGFKRIANMRDESKRDTDYAEGIPEDIKDVVLTTEGWRPAHSWWFSGVRKIFRVFTAYGFVDATDNEPFLVQEMDGSRNWKLLSDLRINDRILLSEKVMVRTLEYTPSHIISKAVDQFINSLCGSSLIPEHILSWSDESQIIFLQLLLERTRIAKTAATSCFQSASLVSDILTLGRYLGLSLSYDYDAAIEHKTIPSKTSDPLISITLLDEPYSTDVRDRSSMQGTKPAAVVRIVEMKGSHETFDLTVPDHHNYCANGIVVHNTETRISNFAHTCLMDKRFDDAFIKLPNYDHSAMEPLVFPAQLPLVLALDQRGIAMGYTSLMPSFTIGSLYTVVMKALKAKDYKLSPKYLAKTLVFSKLWGGEVISPMEDRIKLMATGVQSIEWVCDYEFSESGKDLHITGFPLGWGYDSNILWISKLDEVASVADMSNAKGIDIHITFKSRLEDGKLDAVHSKIIKRMHSKVSYKCNVTTRYIIKNDILDESSAVFEMLNVVEIIQKWIKWRVTIERKALKDEFEDLKGQHRRVKLLLLAIDNLQIIFEILKRKGIDKVAVLSKKLKISEEDAKTIWAIAVGRLDRLNREELQKEQRAIRKRSKEVKRLHRVPSEAIAIHMKTNELVLKGVK